MNIISKRYVIFYLSRKALFSFLFFATSTIEVFTYAAGSVEVTEPFGTLVYEIV